MLIRRAKGSSLHAPFQDKGFIYLHLQTRRAYFKLTSILVQYSFQPHCDVLNNKYVWTTILCLVSLRNRLGVAEPWPV